MASEEEFYQTSRKFVSAEMQIITHKGFLPALLRPHAPAMSDYAGYQSLVDPSITNEFSTALFRFGLSLLSLTLFLLNNDGSSMGNIAMVDAFFRPVFIVNDPFNVDRLLTRIIHESGNF